MVAPTCFGITLSSSGSVPSAFWDMLNWGAVDRILWIGVLILVTWCVPTTSLDTRVKEAIQRKLRGLLSSGVCLQRDDARRHTASHTVKQILDLKFGGVTPSVVFTRLGTQRLPLHLGPARRCTWMSYQIRLGGKEGVARVTDSATKRRLLPRNLYPPRTLEQEYRRRWGLHWI
jgi:hypothetical protein